MASFPSRLVCKKLHYPAATTIEDRKHMLQKALGQLFEPLQATEIFIPGHRRKNYAIISFASAPIAEKALRAISLPHALFDELKKMETNRPPNVKAKRTSHAEQQQRATIGRLKEIMDTECIDFILQCTKSHSDRIQQLFTDMDAEHTVEVKGIHYVKDISLLFCQASRPQLVVNYLHSKWYIQDNFQRVFILRHAYGGRVETDSFLPLFSSSLFSSHEMASVLLSATNHHQPSEPKCLIRLQVYPPRIHSQVLERLEDAFTITKRLSDHHSCMPDRKAATHTLSLLELVPPLESNSDNGYYILAYTPQSAPTMFRASPPMVGHATCRAYWKLAEAVERYLYAPPSSSGGGHGIDVGASPGGWTQYLIQSQKLSRVYSVDPGDLDSFVLSLQASSECDENKRKKVSAVRHVRATYSCGIPQIAQDRRDAHTKNLTMVQQSVQWYVSDMSVKTLGEQIDALLLAVRQALVTSGTFIILTLKCTRGHSKAAYDLQVEDQLHRIRLQIKNLHVMHLFSNRSSERTIMGYWK